MFWLKLICALPPALAAMFLGVCGCDGERCRFKVLMALPRLRHGCRLAQVTHARPYPSRLFLVPSGIKVVVVHDNFFRERTVREKRPMN